LLRVALGKGRLKSMGFWNWFIAVGGCGGVTYFYYWLIKSKRIPGAGFCVAYPVTFGLVLVLARLDVVSRFEVPGGFAMNMEEIRDIKKDVYAKADAVQKLAEAVAQLSMDGFILGSTAITMDNASSNIKGMVVARDQALQIMKEAGTSEERVKEIRTKYSEQIRQHMSVNLYHFITDQFPTNREAYVPILQKNMVHQYDRQALEAELKKAGVWDERMAELVRPLDHFIRTQELPPDYK
jgi:hypothetical protein